MQYKPLFMNLDFEHLQSYYDYLENDNSLTTNISLSNSLLILRSKTSDNKTIKHNDYEIYFCDYIMNSGSLNARTTQTNGETYPNFELFDDDLQYTKLRAKNVSNPKYKAKYNHLLWESKHKRIGYAKLAIDNYFKFLLGSTQTLEGNSENHWRCLTIGLEQLADQKRPGLYYVQVDAEIANAAY